MQQQTLSANINIRVTPQMKAELLQLAEEKGITLSEYIMLMITNYQRIAQELVEAKRTPIQTAADVVVSMSAKREAEIKREAINEYVMQSQEADGGEIESLKNQLKQYYDPSFEALYDQLKGNQIRGKDRRLIPISSRKDLLRLMADNYTFNRK